MIKKKDTTATMNASMTRLENETQIHEFIFPNEENYVLWLLEFIQRKSKIC